MKEKFNEIIHSKKIIVILTVILIILVGVASTYAWFTWSSTNNTSLTMSIGELADVSFTTGNDISTNSLSPVFNYTDGEKTTFIISNKSDTNIKYKILLNITSIDNELKSNNLKYKLLSDDNIIKEGDFTNIENQNILYEGELSKGKVSYTFYLYIDGNLDNSLDLINKSINGNITVEAKEDKDNLATYITNLYTNADKTTITNNSIEYNTATSVNLMNDRLGSTSTDINGGNIRYYGANPNNYIYFNCSDYSNQSDTTCEKWRIIGVFDGKVKLIRDSSIGTFSWDNKDTTTGAETAYGKNDWTTARLMKLLNPSDYYTVDSNDNSNGQSLYWNSGSGKCFAYKGNSKTSCDFTSTGIKNDTTRNLIAEVTYNIGGWYNNSSVYPNAIYEKERGTIVYSGRPTTWPGKIALMYPSDYGYAADLSLCKDANKNDLTIYQYDSDINNYQCRTNNYLYKGTEWLMTHSSLNSFNTWTIDLGSAKEGYVSNMYATRPVLFLKSVQELESGSGTQDDPYRLAVG